MSFELQFTNTNIGIVDRKTVWGSLAEVVAQGHRCIQNRAFGAWPKDMPEVTGFIVRDDQRTLLHEYPNGYGADGI